jgi:hypothetical protein
MRCDGKFVLIDFDGSDHIDTGYSGIIIIIAH